MKKFFKVLVNVIKFLTLANQIRDLTRRLKNGSRNSSSAKADATEGRRPGSSRNA